MERLIEDLTGFEQAVAHDEVGVERMSGVEDAMGGQMEHLMARSFGEPALLGCGLAGEDAGGGGSVEGADLAEFRAG